jgi:hypothetical protein
MEEMKFGIWRDKYEEGLCVVKPPVGMEKGYEVERGISRLEGWPAGVECRMDSEYPKDIELSDNLYGAGVPTVSAKLKEYLIAEEVDNVEFLPVTILNHKERVASRDYFIMNPLSIIECIDLQKSTVKWNRIDKELISSCKQLVLDDKAIPDNCKIFRAKCLPIRIIVRGHFVKALGTVGFKGLCFTDTLKYIGI